MFEKPEGETNRFTSPVVRVVAAIFLLIILWGTFQFITWSFIKVPPAAATHAPTEPMA